MDLTIIAKVLSAVLVLSESLAVIQVLLFPNNKGFGGVVAAIIKFLKGLGINDQAPPPAV